MAGRKPNGNRQSCQEAYDGAKKQILEDVSNNRLDKALHTIEDSYSPSHAGYQLWDGGWTSLHIPSPSHTFGDSYVSSSDTNVQAATDAAERFIADFNTGSLRDPASYLRPNPCR